jgi:2-dehydropantoate 2-reductase
MPVIMKRVAVIGPGAIGGTVAAWLSQSADVQLTVCARTRVDKLVVDTPSGVIATKLHCVTEAREASPVDWILVATKTYDAAATAAWFTVLSTPSTRIAVLQNGVEHVERFTPWWPVERILPAVVECPAERIVPGRILQRRDAWIAVPESAAATEFKSLFPSQFVDIRLTDDFTSTAWRKLCLNAAGAVSALVMKPAGIVHRDDMAELMRGLILECIAVGRAEGARLDDALANEIIAGMRAGSPDSINSLLADRLAGRRMEIDARNGVIVRRGAAHGIETPLNRLVASLLSAGAVDSG